MTANPYQSPEGESIASPRRRRPLASRFCAVLCVAAFVVFLLSTVIDVVPSAVIPLAVVQTLSGVVTFLFGYLAIRFSLGRGQGG